MATSTTYRDRLCLIAIDEAHCIQYWYKKNISVFEIFVVVNSNFCFQNKSSENTGYKMWIFSNASSDRLQCFTLKNDYLTPFARWKKRKLMFILSLDSNLHKKRMWHHGQAIRTCDPAIRWEEDDTGIPKRLAIEPNIRQARSQTFAVLKLKNANKIPTIPHWKKNA